MEACVKVLAILWLPRLVMILVGLNLIGELGLLKNRPSRRGRMLTCRISVFACLMPAGEIVVVAMTCAPLRVKKTIRVTQPVCWKLGTSCG